MSLPAEEYYNIIRDGLTEKQKDIKQRYINGETSMAWLAEQFIQELLNIVFDGEFSFNNLNYKKSNYPAVDLGDVEKGVAWQITVTSDKQGVKKKIKETLKSFYRNNKKEQYTELKKFNELNFFFAGGLEVGVTKDDIPECVRMDDDLEIKIEDSFCSKENVWDFERLITKISEIPDTGKLERIKNVVVKLQKRPIQKEYKFEIDYIPRTIRIDDESKVTFTKDIFKEDRRHILLLANAAEGKTTYTDYLANYFFIQKDVFCIRARFIRYARSLKSLIEAECANWKNYYRALKLIIILDGLDEVNGDEFDIVFKEVEEFIDLNPNANIITTCRTNYSPIKLKDNENENFKAYPCYLEGITDGERFAFIKRKLGSQAEEFINKLKESPIITLIENPFFLTQLIELYQKKDVIPESKSTFMTMILDERFQYEMSKNGVGDQVNDLQLKIEKGLMLLSLVMQMTGENKVTEKQLQGVIEDRELRMLIKRLLLIQVDDEGNEWRFVHNNFWEYYAAKCLNELEWDEIKRIIEIPNTDKLRPRWLNALSFYVGMADEDVEEETYDSVVKWLLVHNQESIVKFEVDKVPLEQRTSIVKSIFETKNKAGIRIWGEGYTVQDLARFAEINNNDELHIYLLDKLSTSVFVEMLALDAIDLINTRKSPGKIKDAIVKSYMSLYSHDYNSRQSVHVLSGLHSWQIYDDWILKELVSEKYGLSGNNHLSTLFSYIADSKYSLSGDYLLRVLEAISLDDTRAGFYYYHCLVDLIDSKEELKYYLIGVTKSKQEDDRYYKWRRNDFWQSTFVSISNKAIELFKDDKECVKIYLDFVIYVGYFLNRYRRNVESINGLKPYLLVFLDCKSVFHKHLLKDFLKEQWDWGHFVLPALLYKDEYAEMLFEELANCSIHNSTLWSFKNVLFQINEIQHNQFVSEVNTRFNNLFEPKPDEWELQRKEQEALMFKCLLDKDLFASIIKDSFLHFENEIIEYKDLHRKEFDDVRPLTASLDIAIEFLRFDYITKDGSATKSEILQWFDKEEEWEWYQITKYCDIFSNSEFPEENFNWCKNWSKEIEEKVNFDTPIEWGVEGRYTINNLFRIYVILMLYTATVPSMNNCIKLMRYIGFFGEYSMSGSKGKENICLARWLHNILGTKVFNKEVRKVLYRGVYDSITLQEFARYIEDNNPIDIIDELLHYINNEKVAYHIRNHFFNLYVKLGGTYNEVLLEYLRLIKNANQIEWGLLDYLSRHNRNAVGAWVEENYENMQLNVNGVCVLLFDYRPMRAMDIYKKELKKVNAPLSDRFYDYGNFLANIKVEIVDSEELKIFLINLLTIYSNKTFRNGEYDDTIHQIFDCFKRLFKLDNDVTLMKDVDCLIVKLKQSPFSTDNMTNMEFWNVDFKTHCHHEVDSGKSFKKALKECKSILSIS